MHVVRFINASGQIAWGLDRPDRRVEILAGDPFSTLRPTGQVTEASKRLAPVAPADIFCIGLNYREHARESGMEPPAHPVVFMKPRNAVIGPDEPIRIPGCCGEEVDYECELAVVIGKRTCNVREAEALDHVLGYTCANDISARAWQFKKGGGQWVRGKGFDTFCPLGPVLVTADEVPDPQALSIRTLVNGRLMQNHNTADMLFSVAQLIQFLSQGTTLEAGTVILTGTPPGVGFARTPPIFLRPGDEVVVEIERIGRLSNCVVTAEPVD